MYSGVVSKWIASISSTSSSRCADRPRQTDAEIPPPPLKELVDTYKGIVREKAGRDFPQDVRSSCGVRSARCSTPGTTPGHHYRKLNRHPRRLGHGVNVQYHGLGKWVTMRHGRRLHAHPAIGTRRSSA